VSGFRNDPATGDLQVVADDFCRPNGLAFAPGGQRLHIADTRQEPSHLRVFDVTGEGALTGGKIFAECDNGRVQHDERDAQAALAFIRPDRTMTADIRPASDTMRTLLAGGLALPDAHQQDFVLGNIKARQRMIAQYAVAGALRGLVVGTDHAAEAVTGFFTKHGDGAADVVPLAGADRP
jgi:NH3-dependent NAD+ synthetase